MINSWVRSNLHTNLVRYLEAWHFFDENYHNKSENAISTQTLQRAGGDEETEKVTIFSPLAGYSNLSPAVNPAGMNFPELTNRLPITRRSTPLETEMQTA